MSLRVKDSDVVCRMEPVTDNLGNQLFVPVCEKLKKSISNKASSGSSISNSASSQPSAGEESKSEGEDGPIGLLPPVNEPYPFKMIPFPYALVGAARNPPNKEGLRLRGID